MNKINKPRFILILSIFLISLLAPEAQATNHLPPSSVVLPMQQQDDNPRTAQLGENRGQVPEGSSETWTYQGQAGEVLTISAYADKPARKRKFDMTKPSTLTISPSATDGPETQCVKGIKLALDGKPSEALPQLEAAFANREATTFTNPEILGYCAAFLGRLRYDFGNHSSALEAYQVALNSFQASGNRELEATTINNIGDAYQAQGKYEQALAYYEQALLIFREVGDRAGEGSTLNYIGLAYDNQGKYEQALAYYEQALLIRREVGDRAGVGTTTNNIGAVYVRRVTACLN